MGKSPIRNIDRTPINQLPKGIKPSGNMNTELFLSILAIESESYNQDRMIRFILDHVATMPGVTAVEKKSAIYITKGNADSYPCVVAHLDTVHDILTKGHLVPVYIDKDNVTGFNSLTKEQSGIGGDDKVGIFIALECLAMFDNIKIAFFPDEEVGCEGSYKADMTFFDDVNFVLQCDRQGYGDFITTIGGTQLSDKNFQNTILPIVKAHGYKYTSGGMTDVQALKEIGLKVACANMSCGYFNPHRDNEYINIPIMRVCMSMVQLIIRTVGHIRFEHSIPMRERSGSTYDRNGYARSSSWHTRQNLYGECAYCGEPYDKANVTIDDAWCDVCGYHASDLPLEDDDDEDGEKKTEQYEDLPV